MSTQGDIFEFMAGLQKGAGDSFVPLTPDQIALQSGFSKDKVQKTISNLRTREKIEVQRGPNGRDIVAFKVVGDVRTRARRAQVNGAPARPLPARRGATPMLDEYARKKDAFARMTQDFGDLVEATFHENPYAEEGLRLQQRLAAIEADYSRQRERADEAERDYKALRGRRRAEMVEDATKSGALATPGD